VRDYRLMPIQQFSSYIKWGQWWGQWWSQCWGQWWGQ
jgi:hypothetical protein